MIILIPIRILEIFIPLNSISLNFYLLFNANFLHKKFFFFIFRDGSYAGSRGSFQGPPGSEPHLSGNYVDHYGDNSDLHQYPDTSLRYNGGVHYPEDTYGRKPDDYINQHYVEQHAGGQTIYSDQDEHGYHEDLEPPRPEDYREIHNRSKGPHEDPYSDSFHPQHPNSSFHDPRHDSYQGQYDPSSQHQQHDPYLDHDRYSDVPGERRSFDQPGGPAYHHNNSFHDNPNMQDRYVEDQQQRRFEGLPQVRQDPFADDPFHEQNSREMHRQEDLYYRGQSPTGGSDIYCTHFYGNSIFLIIKSRFLGMTNEHHNLCKCLCFSLYSFVEASYVASDLFLLFADKSMVH